MNVVFRPFRLFRFALWFSLLSTGMVAAADLKVKAQLVWGTDDAKPPGQDLKELDPKLREKIRHLRWKNYFVVKREVTGVPTKAPHRVTLSDHCAIDLLDNGGGELMISIFNLAPGGGATLVEAKSFPIDKLKAGHMFVFGGDTKEKWDDAWLVLVTPEEEAQPVTPSK